MTRIYVGLGSNIDRARHLREARRALERTFGPLAVSEVYETGAVGFEGAPFFNAAIGADTGMALNDVLVSLRSIEDALGRQRDRPRFGPREIDLDLLLYGDLKMHAEGIDLPRREVGEQPFVLFPLADIAPDLRHPETGERIGALREAMRQRQGDLSPIPFDWESDA